MTDHINYKFTCSKKGEEKLIYGGYVYDSGKSSSLDGGVVSFTCEMRHYKDQHCPAQVLLVKGVITVTMGHNHKSDKKREQTLDSTTDYEFISDKGICDKLTCDGYMYGSCTSLAAGGSSWACELRNRNNCRGRVHLVKDYLFVFTEHNHQTNKKRKREEVFDPAIMTPQVILSIFNTSGVESHRRENVKKSTSTTGHNNECISSNGLPGSYRVTEGM